MIEEFDDACKYMYISKYRTKDLSDKAKELICYFSSKLPYGVAKNIIINEFGFEIEETIQELLNKEIIAEVIDKDTGKVFYC